VQEKVKRQRVPWTTEHAFRHFLAILGLVCSLMLSGCRGAEEMPSIAWQPLSPLLSGHIHALAITPFLQNQALYAGAEGGVYKSTDDGTTWARQSEGMSDRVVRALAIDPDRPDTLYAGTRGGRIYKSVDAAEHWQDVTHEVVGAEIIALAVDPSNPEIVHVATAGRVYTTLDGGQRWQMSSLSPDSDITCLTISPQNPFLVYVGTRDGMLHVSPDRGTTWFPPIQVAPSLEQVVVAPGDGQTLYAIGDGRVYRSRDQGQHWEFNDNYLDKAKACCLTIRPQNAALVLVGTTLGIYKSSDGRQTWHNTEGIPQMALQNVVYNPVKADTAYATIGRRVYRSRSQGDRWELAGQVDAERQAAIYALQLDARAANVIYASAGGAGLYRSSDGGQQWQLLEGLPSTWVTAVEISPKEPDVLYAATLQGRVYRSADGGTTWRDISAGLPLVAIRSLAIDADHPNDLYVGTWGAGVYLTHNWETGWQSAESPFRVVIKVVVDTRAGRHDIYALAENGAWQGNYDREGRLAWQLFLGPLSDLSLVTASEARLVAIGPEQEARVGTAAAAADVVIRQSVSPSASQPALELRLVVQDPTVPQRIYGAAADGSIWRSNDLGQTWTALGSGLEGRRISVLALHPISQTLYAGTDEGVFVWRE